MLNDLYAIELGMVAAGMSAAARHSDVKGMGKGSALRVQLGPEGQFAAVEIVPDSSVLWTLRTGQHNSFPGLKLGKPAKGLLLIDAKTRKAHEEAWRSHKRPTERRNELLNILKACSVDKTLATTWPGKGHRKIIGARLTALRCLADDPLTASVPAAFERFLSSLKASVPFVDQLISALAEKVRSAGDDWLEPAHKALTGPVTLAIDVAESDFERYAGDARQIEPVSKALSERANSGECALTGERTIIHSGNFPEPNLPSLGQVKLFSRNPVIPSLSRYGRLGDASFPVGADLLGRMSEALRKLTAERLHNRTWRRVPGERLVVQNGKKVERWDLLIASLPSSLDLPLTQYLAGGYDDDEEEVSPESRFKEKAERVISQSRGKFQHDAPEDQIGILVLRRVDKGNHKAVYHRRTSAGEFWEAAQRWRAATSNVVQWLAFPLPMKGKSELVFKGAPDVAPLSIITLSRTQFAAAGERENAVGVTARDAFGIFLREGDAEGRARIVLRMLLQRCGSMLAGIAAARLKGLDHLKDFDPKTDLRRDGLRLVTWLATLLFYLGRAKESYMSDVGFRLGQLLAAADVVHIGYCADVRGGNVPPTLIGNAVFGLAGANPLRALSLLQGRWKPYDAWAKSASSGNRLEARAENDSTKWAIRNGLSQARRIRELCPPLSEELKELKVSDEFRAELLLGYIAGLPPLPKKKIENPSDANIEMPTDEETQA